MSFNQELIDQHGEHENSPAVRDSVLLKEVFQLKNKVERLEKFQAELAERLVPIRNPNAPTRSDAVDAGEAAKPESRSPLANEITRLSIRLDRVCDQIQM